MTDVIHSSSSSSSPSISTPTHNPSLFRQTQLYMSDEGVSRLTGGNTEEEQEVREKRNNERRDQLSLLAFLVTLFRKSFWVACKSDRGDIPGGDCGGGFMEISWPSDVEHVNHVTFDRFDGFLGLPVEFEPEVLRRAPSASATVFGVSSESMQLSYDPRGNIIPTILLLMQKHLYSQGGLQAEGIFRITAGNSQEELVREQLNRGVVLEGTDVHCLAGLIKAWFRELPRGLLDSLSPEQVMQCQSEEDCDALVRLLPPTEASLLDWAINLMADVAQHEHLNRMNAHNIAMVFAPNMTKMDDPLNALMHAVQVMNFLKTLIEKTLREREDYVIESTSLPRVEPSEDNGNQSSTLLRQSPAETNEATIQDFVVEDPVSDNDWETSQVDNITDEDYHCYSTCTEESDESVSCETIASQVNRVPCLTEAGVRTCLQTQFQEKTRSETDQSNNCSIAKSQRKVDSHQAADLAVKIDEDKSKGNSNLSRIHSVTEWLEAWR